MNSRETTFEEAIANRVGIIQANLEEILDRNPDLPSIVRVRLVTVIGKCMPLSSAEQVGRLVEAYGGV